MGYGFGQEDSDVVIVKGVDHLSALALADHEAKVAEQSELLGNRRLLHPDIVR